MSNPTLQPSPLLFFQTAIAYQRSAALKGAVELDLFTAIGGGKETAQALAEKCATSERGMRILCDFLTVLGFLAKQDAYYSLTPDSALFLNRHSPTYVGSAVDFLLSPTMTEGFKDIAATVREGGTIISDAGVIAPDHPVWSTFARAMAPIAALQAQAMTGLVNVTPGRKVRILDLAAGHGLFGITLARYHSNVEVVALDWPHVLEVAQENAQKTGVADRFRTLPGSAFEIEYGDGYDIVLLTHFLHHFDIPTCETVLRKVYASLNEGGKAVTLEFVPNEDRISPPDAATFSLMMLAETPSGDAYTFSEFQRMFAGVGFRRTELHSLPFPTRVVVSYK